MSDWAAIAYGALDLRRHELASAGYELAVTPVRPSSPVFLFGRGAELWRMLASSKFDSARLTGDDLAMLDEFAAMGIAAKGPRPHARILEVAEPWLASYSHELVYALLHSVAEEIGVSLIFIKGPTLHAQHLRERAHSGDVDCWVAPGDDRRLAEAMRAWGWTPLILPFTGTRISHSLTLLAGDWGCAIDVHTSFPGMTIQPAVALRQLHDGSEDRRFASVCAQTPGRADHAVLFALHDMRPFEGNPPGEADVARAARTLQLAGPEVLASVQQLGASYVLAEPLRIVFPDWQPADTPAAPADWSWRLSSSGPRGYLRALRLLPYRQRARVFFRLMWPTAGMMRAAIQDTDASTRSIVLARVRRAGQSLMKLVRDR